MSQKRGRYFSSAFLESEGIIPALPRVISVHIFLRLPLKCMIRCTQVRKSWRTVITDQGFITEYNARVKNSAIEKGTQLLLVHGTSVPHFPGAVENEVYSLHSDDPAFLEHSRIQVPVVRTRLNACFRVVGICDGIVFLADDLRVYGYNFILWNPFIRKSVVLPQPNVTFNTYGDYRASVGFGHDAINNDYKVVRLTTLKDEFSGSECRTLVEVYSLVTHSWKRRQIAHIGPRVRIRGCTSAAFVNGSLHWPASRRETNSHYNFILVFDLSTESFRPEIMMPKSVRTVEMEDRRLELSLSSNQNSIALFTMLPTEGRDVQVWVLNDYRRPDSWTLFMQKQLVFPIGGNVRELFPLCFMKSGELILEDLEEEYWGLFSQEPVTGERRRLEVTGYWTYTVHSYDQTLLLLNNENATSC